MQPAVTAVTGGPAVTGHRRPRDGHGPAEFKGTTLSLQTQQLMRERSRPVLGAVSPWTP